MPVSTQSQVHLKNGSLRLAGRPYGFPLTYRTKDMFKAVVVIENIKNVFHFLVHF